MPLQILEVEKDALTEGYMPHGKVADFFRCSDHEQIASGPAETGKTLGMLQKINALCWKRPNIRALIIRKTYASLKDSAVVSFETKVLGARQGPDDKFDPSLSPVKKVGGDNPRYFDYPNGSRIVISGMDTAGAGSTSKVLSAEYDYIAVNQAEELAAAEWELLTSRCTGRAGGTPTPLVMGDCNPGPPTHWILKRAQRGHLTLFPTTHKDNPMLFDPITGLITTQGERTMRTLDRLTGTRRLRLRDGLWVSSEGAIYPEWDPSVHVITPKQFAQRFGSMYIPENWPRYRSVDFGFTNPFVCQWWTLDPDGRAYLYREIYRTRRLVSEHAEQIIEKSCIGTGTLTRRNAPRERFLATVCDHDAEGRATLETYDIETRPAYKAVERGIEAVKERLAVQNDGLPRLFVLANALIEKDEELSLAALPACTADEIPGYIWKDHDVKDMPVKKDDHGCDAMRMFVAHVDNLRGRYARPARRGGTVIYGGRTY